MQEGVLGITELEMTRLNTRNCPGLKGALGVGFLGELSPNLGDLLSGEAGNRTTVKLLPKKKKKKPRWREMGIPLPTGVPGVWNSGGGGQVSRQEELWGRPEVFFHPRCPPEMSAIVFPSSSCWHDDCPVEISLTFSPPTSFRLGQNFKSVKEKVAWAGSHGLFRALPE